MTIQVTGRQHAELTYEVGDFFAEPPSLEDGELPLLVDLPDLLGVVAPIEVNCLEGCSGPERGVTTGAAATAVVILAGLRCGRCGQSNRAKRDSDRCDETEEEARNCHLAGCRDECGDRSRKRFMRV